MRRGEYLPFRILIYKNNVNKILLKNIQKILATPNKFLYLPCNRRCERRLYSRFATANRAYLADIIFIFNDLQKLYNTQFKQLIINFKNISL